MSPKVDRLFLEAAVKLAKHGLYTTTPNPRVGCLLVKQGVVIGRGWHMRDGEAHAEVAALNDATFQTRGATAYVSLEPCSFTGRTGACTQALIEAGIQRVVVARTDPNPKVSGKGLEALNEAGIETSLIKLESARELNLGYEQRITSGRPWVRLKCAISLDGRTAMASGESRWITGVQARADVQNWRARSCAILTGIGTILADDPELTVRADEFRRDGRFRQPLRVVLDSQLRMSEKAKIFSCAGKVRIYCTTDSATNRATNKVLSATQAECVPVDGDPVSLIEVLADLGRKQINEVLVEAGPRLIGGFIRAGLWDELIVYSAPKFLGSAAQPLAALGLESMSEVIALRAVEVKQIGADTRTIYRRIDEKNQE